MKTTTFALALALQLGGVLLVQSAAPAAQDIRCHVECVGNVPHKLVWQSQANQFYDLWSSPDLSVWTHVPGYPQQGTGGGMEYPITPGTRGFFKISAGPPSGELVLIPGGAFEMGDTFGEGYPWELPVHPVHVGWFYIGRNEVTKALWDAVRAWGMGQGYTDLGEGEGKAPDHPVVSITWYDAAKWCNARSEKEGLTPCYRVADEVYRTGDSDAVTCDWNADGYRLPTEAEREKAARGGIGGRRFPWGDTISHSRTNYYSSANYGYDISPTRDYHPVYNDFVWPYTSPVGSFDPNEFGLCDMVGNVSEWCWDWFAETYYPTSPATDPRGPTTGSRRAFRGGSWNSLATWSRCSFRNGRLPVEQGNDSGFRLARGQ